MCSCDVGDVLTVVQGIPEELLQPAAPAPAQAPSQPATTESQPPASRAYHSPIHNDISFFFAGRVFSPALRPYMIGPMRNADIQNLSFLQASREISNAVKQGPQSLGSESVEFQDAG